MIWSMLFVFGDGVLVLGSMDEEGGEDTPWSSAGGGYRAKKRVSRGGSDSASLMYCLEVMFACGWGHNASIPGG